MTLETEITKITNIKLSKSQILNWLDKNFSNYILNEKSKKCADQKLPCMCCERNIECLFAEIYSNLRLQAEYFELNTILSNELIKYENIVNDVNEKKLWLSNNIKNGLDNLWYFMSLDYPNIRIRFSKGKFNGEYEDLFVEIDGLEFKPIYDFANLFAKLFFEDKLLPNEYEKWKFESGMPD